MASVIYKTDSAGNTVMTSPSGKSTSSPYSSNGGSFVKAQPMPTKTTTPTRTYSAPVAQTSAPAPSYSGGTDDVLNQIKSLLAQQQKAAEEAYKAMYEQQLAQNKQAWESNRNQINRNYKRTDRYINSMYGDAISGSGLSNRTRNYTNWNNNLTSNQQNYTNNDANALSQFNQNKAGAYSTLANGWYNYVLPIYTNRQRNLDDYDYRRYLATL